MNSTGLIEAAQQPQFTVCIPVFNDAGRVGRAIESVLAQTFSDFELIVIDDCSTDNSAQVVRQYNDPRIHFHQNEQNLGCGGTKNKGLSFARAPIFKALDSDDWLDPNYLAEALSVFQRHPEVALVTCSAIEHVEPESRAQLRDNLGPGNRGGLHEGRAFQEHYFRGKSGGNPSQVSVRTGWAQQAGGWDARLVNGDETALWLRVVRGRQTYFIAEPLVHITLHAGSLTARAGRTGLEVCHLARMFRDALVDIPELNTWANRCRLVWTRGYVWFSRGRKLLGQGQLQDALRCWRQIAYFAPLPWWAPLFLLRVAVRGLGKLFPKPATADLTCSKKLCV